MLYALDARFNGAPHGLRRIGVDRHIRVPVVRRFHRRLQLIECVLGNIQRVVGRRSAAARHDLDLRSTGSQIFAGCGENFVPAIRDEARTKNLPFRECTAEAMRPVVGRSCV